MRIVTKNKQKEIDELNYRKMILLARIVYMKAIKWNEVESKPIQNIENKLKLIVEAILIVDDVVI